jgi:hypothetical protein
MLQFGAGNPCSISTCIFLSTMSVMALEAIIFIFSFWFLHYFSLLSSLIHNQEREERS